MNHFDRPDHDFETLHVRIQPQGLDPVAAADTQGALDALHDWAGRERARLEAAAPLRTWEQIATQLRRD